MSRTLVTARYDDDHDGPPVRTYLALRAWMLWRATKDGWVAKKPTREKWLTVEAEQLQADVRSMNVLGGGTGSASADELIRTWWATALA